GRDWRVAADRHRRFLVLRGPGPERSGTGPAQGKTGAGSEAAQRPPLVRGGAEPGPPGLARGADHADGEPPRPPGNPGIRRAGPARLRVALSPAPVPAGP